MLECYTTLYYIYITLITQVQFSHFKHNLSPKPSLIHHQEIFIHSESVLSYFSFVISFTIILPIQEQQYKLPKLYQWHLLNRLRLKQQVGWHMFFFKYNLSTINTIIFCNYAELFSVAFMTGGCACRKCRWRLRTQKCLH